MRRLAFVALALAVSAAAPAAPAAEEAVHPEAPTGWLVGDENAVVLLLRCVVRSNPNAAWTQSQCLVNGTYWWAGTPNIWVPPLHVDDIDLHNMSEQTTTGPVYYAVSWWMGAISEPAQACTLGRASFNQGTTQNEVTAPPLCVDIDP